MKAARSGMRAAAVALDGVALGAHAEQVDVPDAVDGGPVPLQRA